MAKNLDKVNSFSYNLTELRKANNYSRKDLCDIMEIDYKRLEAWENGMNEPSMDHLIKLSLIFGVTLNELIE